MEGRIILEIKHRGQWKLSRRGPELEFENADILDEFWKQVLLAIRGGVCEPYVKRVR